VFSRFTATARRVMQRAFREAKRCQHDFVGTEHLLYGLCCDPEGPAVTLLRTLGAAPEVMLEKIEISLERHDGGMAMEQFPLSPASKRVFHAASDEAAKFNHQMIGPEHLLLGLLRERDGEAAQILEGHGVRLIAVREAVAQIPPDAYHDAQVRSAERARNVPSDNPTVDELEHWVAPPITIDHATDPSNPVYPLDQGGVTVTTPASPFDIEAQVRRTQIFLGAFGGYVVGHWVIGAWYIGLAFALLGVIVAVINRAFVSIPACGMLSLLIAGQQQRWLEPFHPYLYLIALPLGILFGSFLSDFWRFTSVREEQPTSEEGYPVEPSGIAVTPETKLTIGATVLVPAQGRWWRAVVIAFEGPEQVRVRYPGWDAKWEEAVPRSELQVPTH
jgi:hypothetical protein